MTTSTMPAGTYNQMPWWVVLLEGIAALIVGIMLLVSPGITTLVIVQAFGWYWLFSGILSIVTIFLDSSRWGWKLLVGVIGIWAGIAVIQNPLWSTLLVPTTLVWVLGIQGIIMGAIMVFQGFRGDGIGAIILGAISIVFGIMLFLNPMIGALGLPWLLGILGIVGGIFAIFYSFRLR